MENGNRGKNLTIAQWNMGPAHWEKKVTEIEAFLLEVQPDLFFITEANMFPSTKAHEGNFPGHCIILPKTVDTLGYWRIVLIVKETIKVEVLEEFMEDDISSIWVKIGNSGRKAIHIGGLYREHQFLLRGQPNPTSDMTAQNDRWYRMVNMWKKAGNNAKCTMVGDINLDYKRWENPENSHVNMVNKTKMEIEMNGSAQLVKEVTRFWPGTEPSILDQIWTNAPERVINHQNMKRGVSDHNAIIVRINHKENIDISQEIVKRVLKNFNTERYQKSMSTIDWGDYYKLTDVNLINDRFCEHFLEVLDREAPIRVIQPRKGYKNWIKDSTKVKMMERDISRDIAVSSQEPADWQEYRRRRNECSKQLKQDKNQHLEDIYKGIATENDTKKLHKVTKELLGWKTGGPPKQLIIEGKLIQSPGEIANAQMAFFTEKVQKIRESLPASGESPLKVLRESFEKWVPREPIPELVLKELSESEILELISQLGNNTSFGHDYIDALSIKLASVHLHQPIRHLVNTSISSQINGNWRRSSRCTRARTLRRQQPAPIDQ